MSRKNQLEFLNEANKITKGKKITEEAYEQAVTQMYDKSFPVVPGARKGEGRVKPTVKMTVRSEAKDQVFFNGK